MIKVFEQLKAKELAKEINEFEISIKDKNQVVFATQIFPRSEDMYDCFVHYKNSNGYALGIKEEKKGIMKEKQEIGVAWEAKFDSINFVPKEGERKFIKKDQMEKTSYGFKMEENNETYLIEKIAESDRVKKTSPHYKVFKEG